MDSPMPQDTPPWASDIEPLLAALRTGPGGLAALEAARRLAAHGPNRLPQPPRPGLLRRVGRQVHNILIYVLLAAAAVTAVLGEWTDTVVILAVVAINVALGVLQEGRAERALDAVRDLLAPQASVLRDGQRLTVPAEALVPGDLVLLEPGDRVPADLRLLRAKGLQVQEAALTGESVPVAKQVASVAADAALGDRRSMAFSGTLVAAGAGQGVVVATGPATELGRISSLLAEVRRLQTPLLRKLDEFGRVLTIAILALAALGFVVGVVLRGLPAGEMFMAAVGLAVAAIPEGLPAVVTIALAIGVERMARRRAIIRRLPAVEALGSVTVICSDKTGTLTRNELTVRSIVTAGHAWETTGIGYAPRGSFLRDGREAPPDDPDLRGLLRAGALCCDAALHGEGEDWRIDGDPTEGALLVAAAKAGLDLAAEGTCRPRTDDLPFESERRFMATLHQEPEGGAVLYVKGAPERVLEMCAAERADGADRPTEPEAWLRRAEAIAADGQRVLAIAARSLPAGPASLALEDALDGLTLLGLVGLIDPPREEAREAVAECRSAGIAVTMITGDHAATAGAIGRELGLAAPGRVLTGRDLDRMAEAELRDAVRTAHVFARTSPEHKLRLVAALQANGEVVAMTGDGVNDAPALKRADIGVAMGLKGTEAAKETAEMVLADDNFASIVRAVREGRSIYDNLKKTLLFILPTNGGEALTVLAAIAAGAALPVTPVQILWVNLVTAVTLGVALAFEPPEPGVMARPPRPPQEPLLSRDLLRRIALVSVLMLLGTYGVFLWEMRAGGGLEAARTAAVNALVACEVAYLFCTRFLLAPAATPRGLLGSPAVLVAVGLVVAAQAAFTWAPPLQRLFGSVPPGGAAWTGIALAALLLFLVVEGDKLLARRAIRHAGQGNPADRE